MRDLGISDDHAFLGFKDRARPHLDDMFRHRIEQQHAPILVMQRLEILLEQVLPYEAVDSFGKLGAIDLDIGELAGVGE